MTFDFQAAMLLALLATGAVWGFDSAVLAPRRRLRAGDPGTTGREGADGQAAAGAVKRPLIIEYARSFFPIILVVLVLRSFLVEPFRIPSGSMMPTLLAGDFILVSKFSYGVRLPLFGTKILDSGAPRRGDIAVFRYPKDPSVDYIKRIVGLPGDHLAYVGKTLYVNGERMDQRLVGLYTGEGSERISGVASLRVERLGDVEHRILIQTNRRLGEGEFVVPEGHYFAMGDNRDNSNDSRFWGTVPEENLVGKAFMIWMSWDSTRKRISWSRIGADIN